MRCRYRIPPKTRTTPSRRAPSVRGRRPGHRRHHVGAGGNTLGSADFRTECAQLGDENDGKGTPCKDVLGAGVPERLKKVRREYDRMPVENSTSTREAAGSVDLHDSSRNHNVCDDSKGVEGFVTLPTGSPSSVRPPTRRDSGRRGSHPGLARAPHEEPND
ncbi:hypothetical protein ACFUGD_34005 [Streptomyces sp. NPDC057217]|uniref:hypothetical protein n=1 Tax=Streptomyces sp. NPDC057217 TaxID=3346054 RepID=UPI003625B7A2